MYDRILVPLDGSEQAEAALAFAERLPARQVCLLRVEPDFQQLAPGPLSDFRPDWREVRAEQVRRELEPLGERLGARGGRVDLAVRFGEAADEIITAGAEADLIVMTTRGRGAVGRAIFGSTADRVARHGATTTLLLRGGERAGAPVMPKRIVVPLDGSSLAERALPEATRLARVLGLPLHLVRVVGTEEVLATGRLQRAATDQGDEAAGADDAARAQAEGEAERYLARVAEGVRADGVGAEAEVRTGSPAFALLDLLGADDLAVLATHGHGGLRRWLIGSVAEKLVREAAAPVLLVPARSRVEGEATGSR